METRWGSKKEHWLWNAYSRSVWLLSTTCAAARPCPHCSHIGAAKFEIKIKTKLQYKYKVWIKLLKNKPFGALTTVTMSPTCSVNSLGPRALWKKKLKKLKNRNIIFDKRVLTCHGCFTSKRIKASKPARYIYKKKKVIFQTFDFFEIIYLK